MEKSTQERFAAGFRGDKPESGKEDLPEGTAADAGEGNANPPAVGEGGPAGGQAITDAPEGAASGAEELPAVATGEGADNPDAGLHGEMPMGGDPMMGEELSPEDAQREASWKGRLKKMEDDLKARAAALDEREASLGKHNEAAEPASEEMAEGQLEEMAELSSADINSLLASAPSDVKAIAQRFSEEFGEDFISDMTKLFGFIAEASAGKIAAEAIGPLKEQAEGIRGMIDSVIASFNTMHQDDLEDGEPEFEQIVNSPEFEQWVTSQEPDQQSRIVRALQGGSASRIVRILNQFKSSLKTEDKSADQGASIDTSALEAAAGVRSTGASSPSAAEDQTAGMSDTDRFARGFMSVANQSK